MPQTPFVQCKDSQATEFRRKSKWQLNAIWFSVVAMKSGEHQFDPLERAHDKQLSRDDDAARLASGEISAVALRRENGVGSHLPLSRYQMVAIGGRSIMRD